MSTNKETLTAVRLKTGAHAGEVREMETETALELAALGRAEIVPWDDYWFEKRVRRFFGSLGPGKWTDILAVDKKSEVPAKNFLKRVFSRMRGSQERS